MPLQSKFGLNGLDMPNQTPQRNTSIMVSQPRNNLFVTPTRSFRRYSLADTCLTPSPSRQQKHVTHNAHLSTTIDSNSPGFSSRVVQYNKEQEKSQPTHHSKYDKLGVFPIVHFFKKDVPILKRKSADSNTSLVSSPDLSKYNSLEQNRMLLEKIIKTSPQNQLVTSKNEPNTKSVLDALKEISRKRIHANGDDFILKDDGKRMHGEYESENLARKRMKQNVSGEEYIVLNPSSRYSSIDELVASHSSMDGYFSKKPRTEKVVQSPPVKPKPVVTTPQYVNVETQTALPPPSTPAQTAKEDEPKEETPIVTQPEIKPKKPSPIKVFDETPLEQMRRNRLSALMGTSILKPQNENTDTLLHKPLVSILSGSSKSPQKSEKHVTFNIPESTSETVVSSTPAVNFATNATIETTAVTRTSSAVISPIVSASIVESPSQKSSLEVKLPETSLVNVHTTSAPQISKLPVPTFNFASSTSNLTQSTSVSKTEEERTTSAVLSTSKAELPKFQFENSFNKPSTSNDNSAAQKGGFKFELKETTTASAVSTPSFSFMGATSAPPASVTSSAVFSPISTSNVAKPTFSFGTMVTSTSAPLTSSSTFNSTSAAAFSISSAGPFTLSKTPSGNNFAASSTSFTASVSSSNMFGSSNMAQIQTTSSAMPNFANNNAAPTFATNSPNANKPLFNFGASSSPATVASTFGTATSSQGDTSKPFSLGTTFPTTVTTTTAPISFGALPTTTKSNFNANFPPNASPFSVATTKTSSSGNFFFGGSNKTSNFNTNNTPAFGNEASSKTMFGQFPAPSFGATTPAFGATTSAPSFGVTTTTPSFGTPATSAPTFGTSAPAFGTTAPAFGTTTAPSFGVSATPSFGTTAPSFGGNNNAGSGNSAFANVGSTNNIFAGSAGFNSALGSTAAPAFGANSTPNFASNSFGSNEKPGFGGNLNNENKSGFAPSFGSPSFNSGFGVSKNVSGFGTNTNTFSTAPANFGSAGGTFGQSTNSAFSANSPFDKAASTSTNPEPNPFGSSTPSFGSTNFSTVNPQPAQGGVFTFGSNAANKPPVFSFGSEPPKPSFNFQAGNSNTPNMFGSTNAPAFGTVPQPQFNVQSPGASMFSIGSGGSTNTTRSRTQQKGKRRT